MSSICNHTDGRASRYGIGVADGDRAVREDTEARQQLLTQDPPLKFVAVLDESVLHRQCGGRSVMRAQFQQLADRPDLRSVTIQIVPLDTDHGLAVDSFIILEFGDDVVSIEHMSKEVYVEGETDTYQFKLAFDHRAEESPTPPESRELIVHRQAGRGTDDYGRGGAMSWQDRAVTELATICQDALGSWNRTGQLCVMICSIALGLALLIWVFRK